MRKKLITGIILIILTIFSLYKVQAYSGEIDPKDYINLPTEFSNTNGTATGTISVRASGYEISYQKVDISASTFNSITSKNREMNTYYENTNKQISDKEKNLKTLETEYRNLVGSETATEEQKQAAKSAYEAEYQEYETLVNTFNSQMETLKREFYALVPNYTNSWTKTTNTANNVNINLTNYSGTIYFVLWAKITNGTDTYYDFQIYSDEIKKQETSGNETDKKDEQTGNESQEGEWTDFSKATINVERLNDVRKYKFTIANVTVKNNHNYYYFVGDGKTTPKSTDLQQLKYDESKKVLYSGNEIAKYLELGAEQYVYVYERYADASSKTLEKLVVNKAKLEKPAQKKYTDVFFATIISKATDDSDCNTQILFNTPWGDDTTRKVHLRVGKINDDNILRNIYNKKNNAFEDLLNYAKTANAFYDKTLNSNADASAGGVILKEKNPLFSVSNITNNDYYFLYAVVEDESGKYVKTEGVTFARASKLTNNAFQLSFYDSANFTWKTFESNGQQAVDDTTAKGNLPQTGLSNVVVGIISITVIIGAISIILYKRYDF